MCWSRPSTVTVPPLGMTCCGSVCPKSAPMTSGTPMALMSGSANAAL